MKPKALYSRCLLLLLSLLVVQCGRDRTSVIQGNVQLEGDVATHEGVELYIPGTQFRARTDEKGHFSIQGLTPGTWTLVAEREGYQPARSEFSLLHAEEKKLPPLILARERVPAGGVTGFLILPGQASHEEIAVLLVGTDRSAATNTTGHFLMENVPPGTYQLLAVKDGWLPYTRDGVEVIDGEETDLGEVRLESAHPTPTPVPEQPIYGNRMIRGIALLEGENQHEGILVSLESVPEKHVVTNATGFFAMDGLGDETYTLLFSHEGYLPETWSDVLPQDATSPSMAGIVTLRRELAANSQGILEGVVLLEGRTDHSNTLVQLQGISQSVATDNTGRYMFIGIPAGQYTLLAGHPGYETGRVLGVQVAADQISSVTDIQLAQMEMPEPAGVGSLQGIALLEGENDHGGIAVAVQGTSLTALTGPSGEYVFPEVPFGAYTILFSKGGYKNAYLEGIGVTVDQVTSLEPVTLVRDIEPPTVLDSFPPNGSRKVPVFRTVDILVRFSERMSGESVKKAVQIEPPVGFDAFFDNESELSQLDLLHLRLYQTGPMPILFKTRYTVLITPLASTPKGIPLAEPYQFSFTTDGPLLVNTFPQQGANQILLGARDPIMLETNTPINPVSVERAIRIRPRPDALPQIQYVQTDVGTQILINTTLRDNTRYTVQVDNALRSFDGQRFSNTPFSLSFRTTNFGDSFNRSPARPRR